MVVIDLLEKKRGLGEPDKDFTERDKYKSHYLLVSCPDPTHSNEEKGLVLFEQFLGFADLAQVS